MLKADRIRLQHMFDAAKEALDFIQGKRRSDLDADRMLVLSLSRSLRSSVKRPTRYPPRLEDKTALSDGKTLLEMRNRLIHGYFDIDLDIVWITVTKDLPSLKAELEKLL